MLSHRRNDFNSDQGFLYQIGGFFTYNFYVQSRWLIELVERFPIIKKQTVI